MKKKRYIRIKQNGRTFRIDLFRLTASVSGLLGLLIFAWLVVSWADVVLHNCTDQAFAAWNAWTLIFGR